MEEESMRSKLFAAFALFAVVALVLAGCGPAETPTPTAPPDETEPVETEPVETEPPVETELPGVGFKACQVSDTGGTDDRSFNQFAWVGMEQAEIELGVEIRFLESTSEADYAPNLNAFVGEGCDMIFGVGYLLNDATMTAATENPDVLFVGIDTWDTADNFLSSGYSIAEATMLAGYLAAGMTETGIVGVYAGMNIPPVTAFSDGYYLGIQAYNEAHGTTVTLEGWDPEAQDGLFTGDFTDADKGRTMTEVLLDAGADIIMPVAGPVGAGSLAVMAERDAGLLIGVDTDWSSFFPEYSQYVLASAMKRMDLVVYDQINAMVNGTFTGGYYNANLENGRVSLAVGADWIEAVPDDLMDEINALAAQIISGEVSAVYPRSTE
jgi:basic membrane protein A